MNQSRPADYLLQTLVLLVVGFGLFMLTSASSILSFEKYGDSYFLIKRQLLSFAIGFGSLLFFSRFDYRKLKAFARLALLVTIGLLVAVLLPGVGKKILGAQRWIALGPIFFQPSELVKLTLLIYLATWLDRRRLSGREGTTHLRSFLLVLGVTAGLVLLEPDLGTMLVIGCLSLAVYFSSGAPYKHMLTIGVLTVLGLLLVVVIEPYRLSRLTVFLKPSADTQGEAYHINQSLIAIGSGGPVGVGLGHSRQKFNYLPEAYGDSIFAIIAEETGFITAITLIGLYTGIALRGFRIGRATADPFGRTLAVGITSWLVIQAFLNIGALSGILPLTGIPLPLISYGGSAMIVTLSAVGILLNISRSTRLTHERRA